MSVIDLSSGFTTGLPNRILRFNENTSTTNLTATSGLLMAGGNSYGNPGGRIAIMKGTVPPDLSSLTSWAARSVDRLVEFAVKDAHFAPTQYTVNPVVISTIYVNAAAAGIATWFWWTVRPIYQFDNPDTIIHQIVGTVGLTGSGADLEMDSVSITAGEFYRIINLRVEFLSNWTY